MNVLHISSRPDRQHTKTWLAGESVDSCLVKNPAGVADATRRLDGQSYDAIVVELDHESINVSASVQQIKNSAVGTPVLAVTDGTSELKDASLGLDGIFSCDELPKISFDNAMREALRQQTLAVVDINSRLRENLSSVLRMVDPVQEAEPAREEPARRSATFPVTLFPIVGEQVLDYDWTSHGKGTVDEDGQLRLVIVDEIKYASERFLVSASSRDGQQTHAAMVVEESSVVDGTCIIDGRIANAENDLLAEANLIPCWNPEKRRFETRLTNETAELLSKIGVIRPYLYDRVIVCPDCLATPTVRLGCRSCGSAKTDNRQLIHHFACAHVGSIDEYERDDRLVCPKCRVKNLVVGADFEYLEGPHECCDCGWSDIDLEMVAQCHDCQLRFSMELALEEDLIAYHVERMDPLAIIASS